MDIKDIVRPLRAWWWLILLAALVAGVTSFFVTRSQPQIYRTRTTLIVGANTIEDPNPNGGQLFLNQQLANIYADIGKRDPVRTAVMDTLLMTWLPAYTIFALPNTQLIEVRVEDVDPVRAKVVADELARQLILQGPAASDEEERERIEFVDAQLNRLEEQIEATSDDIEQKRTDLGSEFSARKIDEIRDEIGVLDGKLRVLQSNYSSLLANSRDSRVNQVTVLEIAEVPTDPVGPDILNNVIVAASIGIALAAAAAYLLEYLDDSVKTTEDIEEALGLPILTAIAEHKQPGNDDEPVDLIVRSNPRSPIAESYRSLRTTIQFAELGDEPCKTLLVTSANPSEGKSITAANLALVLAQGGNRVLLVDADLRRPMQHKLFSLDSHPGLTGYVFDMGRKVNGSAEAALRDSAILTKQPGLYLLPAGYVSPNPSEVLGSRHMNRAVELARAQFDYIVFDSPPVLAVTDAVVLAAQVDGVILTVHASRTRAPQLTHMKSRLDDVEANCIGVVLNRIGDDSETYQYYYDQSAYMMDSESIIAEHRKIKAMKSGD